MANVKITDLSAASTPLTGSEELELVQSGVSVRASAAVIGNSATALPFASVAGRAYYSGYDVNDQTGNTAAATAVKIGTTAMSQGISITNNGSGNPTRITFAAAGTYMIAPSIQLANSGSSDYDATFWFRKNGTDIAASATVVTVPKLSDGGASFFQIVVYEQVTAGQYVEVMWLPENASITLEHTAAGAIAPAIPSALVVSERIA